MYDLYFCSLKIHCMSITWINTDPCSYNSISRLSLRELPTYYSLAISISFHFLSPEIYYKKINMQLLLCIGLVVDGFRNANALWINICRDESFSTLNIFYCSIINNWIGHKFHNLEKSSPNHSLVYIGNIVCNHLKHWKSYRSTNWELTIKLWSNYLGKIRVTVLE